MNCSASGSSVCGDSSGKNTGVGGLLCPPPGDLPDPGIKLKSLMSPALAGRFFTARFSWEAPYGNISSYKCTCEKVRGVAIVEPHICC